MADNERRICIECKKGKPLTDYYMVQGKWYQSRCKPCHIRNCKETKDPIRTGITEAIRGQRRYGKRGNTYSQTPNQKAYMKKWRKNNKHKIRAHYLVSEAIKHGELIRPLKCVKCQKEGKIEASHSDYKKPLMIEWLCSKCHRIKDNGKWIHLIKNAA